MVKDERNERLYISYVYFEDVSVGLGCFAAVAWKKVV